MDQQLVDQTLTGDSDEIADLKLNISILEGFIELARQLEILPDTNKRFYEESRSLYQATCTGRSISDLEALLSKFFGPPVKPAGKALPRKLRKNASVKYLGGIEKDQSLFLLPLNTGEFYGALWPWRRNKAKIEIHMGYCSDWMSDAHYQQLDTLVKRSLSHSAFQHMDAQVGGQIRGIGLPSFLQMAELEQSTFTLRITSAGRVGQLHVAEGQLVAAETSHWTGREAAYRIISWDDASIEIEPADPSRKNEINQPLMHMLMESLKLKDEITSSAEAPPAPPEPKARRPKPAGSKPAKRLVRLERPPEPRPPRRRIRLLTAFVFLLGALVILGSGAVVGLYVMQHRTTADRYAQLLVQVDQTESLERQRSLLESYLADNPESPHAPDIQSRINEIKAGIEARDFEQTTLEVSSLPVDESYEEKALALYTAFLEKYPDSRYAGRINTAIGEIKNLLDQFYYEELRRAARLDYTQRLTVYRQYLDRFPDGRYQADVNFLILQMGEQYLDFLKTEDERCDQQKRWEPCIQRYQLFIESHEGIALAAEAQRRMNALKDKADLARLRKVAEESGTNLGAAVTAYERYLAENPATTQKQAIEAELSALRSDLQSHLRWTAVEQYATDSRHNVLERIQRLERYLQDNRSSRHAPEAQSLLNELASQRQQALRQRQSEMRRQEDETRRQQEQARMAEQQRRVQQLQAEVERRLSGSARYRSNGDGTVTDGTTGLIWTLLDSQQTRGNCMDYASTRQYVQSLRTGGYGDWRMPSANELAALYKQTPYFPGAGAEWYWTAEAYVRGHHAVADVVTTRAESVFIRENRSQDACGAVRAVRR